MAIYHFSASPIARSAGRSATAAAAYRAGCAIVDERTGEVHDYTRKRGVEHAELFQPGGRVEDRAAFWNRIEAHHKRGDAVLARELVLALPAELTDEQRRELVSGYARELAERYGVAADLAMHAPGREGDHRNHHAHIMLSACHVERDGTLGKKAVELDPIASKRAKRPTMVEVERERWAVLANAALERAGLAERIDHRSLADQGVTEREPTVHLGPAATAVQRRGEVPDIDRREAEKRRQAQAERAQLEAAERAERQTADELEVLRDARAGIAEARADARLRRELEAAKEQARQQARQARERQRLAEPGITVRGRRVAPEPPPPARVPRGWTAEWSDQARQAVRFVRQDREGPRHAFTDEGDRLAATGAFQRRDCGVMLVAALQKWPDEQIELTGPAAFQRDMAYAAARLRVADRLADRQLAEQAQRAWEQSPEYARREAKAEAEQERHRDRGMRM